MKNFKGLIALCAVVILAFAMITVVSAADPESAQANSVENSVESGTWCWFGTCDHPSKYITYYYYQTPGNYYYVSSQGTEYEYRAHKQYMSCRCP